jgi:CoA:oxalate CoA-transferase
MTSNAQPGPLVGITVLDLTRVLAGPYCTMLLADLGARVIKVEMPGSGDDSRHAGPFIGGKDGVEGTSAYFFSVNRNKESIALDLKNPDDRAVLDRLIDVADVMVENFRPGTMEKLGYAWETVHARKPELIYASVSGYGQTGPSRDLPAYDMVVQALGGIMSLTGPDGSDEPVRVGVSIGDLAAGMFAALGVQAALIERARTGVGKRLDVSLLDCQVALVENAIVRYQVNGRVPHAIGSRHPQITPFACFRVDDGQIVIAAGNNTMFARLGEALGCPEFKDDPRFATNGARTDNHLALQTIIEERLAGGSQEEWVARLSAAGVPASRLNDMAALLEDGQVAHRNMLVDLPTPHGTSLKIAGTPIKFTGEPSPTFRSSPLLDEHGAAIRAELGAPP